LEVFPPTWVGKLAEMRDTADGNGEIAEIEAHSFGSERAGKLRQKLR